MPGLNNIAQSSKHVGIRWVHGTIISYPTRQKTSNFGGNWPTNASTKISGIEASILQGELTGLISTSLLCNDSNEGPPQTLYTDHKNSVHLIDDLHTNTALTSKKLRHMNARSYYRWLEDVLTRRPTLKVEYTKAHTLANSIPARLNDKAEHHATRAQTNFFGTPSAPIPTFFMDDYTLHNDSNGWMEINPSLAIQKCMEDTTDEQLTITHSLTMSKARFDKHPPPDYAYMRAYAAYSPLVQLYARSRQLPTGDLLCSRGKLDSQMCRRGCREFEDMHHVFVECKQYTEWWEKAATETTTRTNEIEIGRASCRERVSYSV